MRYTATISTEMKRDPEKSVLGTPSDSSHIDSRVPCQTGEHKVVREALDLGARPCSGTEVPLLDLLDSRKSLASSDPQEHAVSILDLSGVILYEDSAASAMFGHLKGARVGRLLSDFVQSADHRQLQLLLEAALAGDGNAQGARCRHRHGTGPWQTIDLVVESVTQAPSVVIFVVHSCVARGEQRSSPEESELRHDRLERPTHAPKSSSPRRPTSDGISEVMLYQQALRQQQELLRAVFDNMAEAVVMVDDAGVVRLWNRAAEMILGRRAPTEPMAQWPTDRGVFLPGSTPWPLQQTPLARALRGEKVSNVQVFIRQACRPEGTWVSVNATPLTDGASKSSGAIAVFRDITEERRLQAQILVSDRMASVGMLAAGVAHEINNPLAAVIANLDLASREVRLLAQKFGAENVRNLGEEIADARSGSQRVRRIVRDLKLLSRSEDDSRGPVDVRQVLQSSARTASHEIRHRAQVVRDFAPVPLVEANDARLGQVFLNLIVNAAQAIPEGDAENNEIRLVTRTDDTGRVVVEVRDTGSGMSPETIGRLFTPFFTTKPAGVGTGLGLSICQRIVTGLGGDIQVESQPGKGSVFRVILPATADRITPVAEVIPSSVPAPRRGHILVVDDDSALLAVTRRILGRDHDIVLASRAQDALQHIASGIEFDVILCDLMMPQVTGMELYAELQRVAPTQVSKIIFLTGGTFTTAARDFLDQVPNQSMEKPFDVQALRAVVADRLR